MLTRGVKFPAKNIPQPTCYDSGDSMPLRAVVEPSVMDA